MCLLCCCADKPEIFAGSSSGGAIRNIAGKGLALCKRAPHEDDTFFPDFSIHNLTGSHNLLWSINLFSLPRTRHAPDHPAYLRRGAWRLCLVFNVHLRAPSLSLLPSLRFRWRVPASSVPSPLLVFFPFFFPTPLTKLEMIILSTYFFHHHFNIILRWKVFMNHLKYRQIYILVKT